MLERRAVQVYLHSFIMSADHVGEREHALVAGGESSLPDNQVLDPVHPLVDDHSLDLAQAAIRTHDFRAKLDFHGNLPASKTCATRNHQYFSSHYGTAQLPAAS